MRVLAFTTLARHSYVLFRILVTIEGGNDGHMKGPRSMKTVYIASSARVATPLGFA